VNKQKLRNDLVEISEFERNWDSYGAPAFTKTLIDKVNIVIDHLDDQFPDPCIVPSSMGIQFEWDIAKYDALEISVDGVYGEEISYLRIIGEDMEDWVDKKISDISEINELLKEFYKK